MATDRSRPSLKLQREVAETDLARAWASNRFPWSGLQTVTGIEVTVAGPGQQNSDSGPDFLDAVIRFADGPFERGPVELPRRPSDWRAHGHESDLAYSNILLHVVVHVDGHGQIAGRPIVELPMNGPGRSSTTATPRVSIRQLERLGDARFDAFSAQLEGDIAAVGPAQTLYEGLMGALGYSKNSESFRELARLVPFTVLQEFGSSLPTQRERELRIAGLLFGAAGLLPTQRRSEPRGIPDPYSKEVVDVWTHLGDGRSLPSEVWRTFRVRPDNAPVRRIGAAASMVSRWLANDLVHRMVGLAQQDDARRAAMSLVRTLGIGAEGYWGARRDFRTLRPRGLPAALIGRSRALEITTSVALPFLLALADWNADRLLETRVRSMFAALPAGPANSLARWAAPRSLAPALRRQRLTARQQQGLLFLAKARI